MNSIRLKQLEEQLALQYKLLNDFEYQIMLTSNPREKANAEHEKKRVQEDIKNTQREIDELRRNPGGSSPVESSPASASTPANAASSVSESKAKTARDLQVFLCHASQDKEAVRGLYEKLDAEDGIKPWLDEEELLPGQDWNLEIEKALKKSDAIVICVSTNSVGKEGYVQREIKRALRIAEEKPFGTVFVIPVKLDKCDLPYELEHIQSVNLFDQRGYERLVKSLRLRADQLPR